MFTSQQISEAKNKSIAGYLKSRNIEPVNIIGSELLYFSPLRSENTPSFHVNPNKNSFNDFGGSEEMKGDSIRLVQQIEKCTFIQAVKILLDSNYDSEPSFSFSGFLSVTDQGSRIKINSVTKLKNKALIRYVMSRGILLEQAFEYLNEVHYQIDTREYFAVGFKNDNGGFDLRNGLGFKGKTENGISVIDKGTNAVSVFEGFFDFLSALRYYNAFSPTLTTIILNTTNNLKLALPVLCNKSLINCYLDNDSAGENVVRKLEGMGFHVKNYAESIYPKHKDFNDFIIKTYNSTLKSDF